MIHSLAGELGLDVYVISLSRVGLDDTALSELITDLPSKCIALMEDIDAAFHHGVNRDWDDSKSSSDSALDSSKPGENKTQGQNGPQSSASRITLSGLLNALDGVGAQEGRILYATTNKYAALDPALCRPGRMDLHVEFKLASQYQARELFHCFYLPSDGVADGNDTKAVSDSGHSSPSGRTPKCNLIDLDPVDENLEPATTEKNATAPIYVGSSHRGRAPRLTSREVSDLAADFAASIPEREFSMASLQGYLMAYKTMPYKAVKEAGAWVEKERAERLEKQKTNSN
jgi:chaperone BCS1